jgi:hypothetical protein
VLFVFAIPAANSEPFETISYQGVLTDQNGVVVPDGSYSIRFRLYLQDETTVAWEETQNVAVAGGRFNVALGEVVSLASVPFDEPYLLGIKVGTDDEMAPLTPLRTVPYSMSARSLVMDPATRYYSVCAEGFNPNNSSTTFNRNTLRVYPTGSGVAAFAAPVHMPDGARLTQLRGLFEDVESTLGVSLLLRRTNVTTGDFESIAAVSSGVANDAGLTTVATSSFSDDIVDNENWAYSLQLYYSAAAGSNLTLMSVRITYEVTEPLP